MADPLPSNEPPGALENDDDYSSIGGGGSKKQRDPQGGLEAGGAPTNDYHHAAPPTNDYHHPAPANDYYDREEDVEEDAGGGGGFEEEWDEEKRRSEIEDDLSQYFDDVEDWDAHQIADYVRDHMYEDEFEDNAGVVDFCCDILIENNVTGLTVFELREADLVEMGIANEEDRNRLLDCLDGLERHSTPSRRFPTPGVTTMNDYISQRDYMVLWRGTEELYFNAFDHCLRSFCMCFPEDPALYELSNTHLEIKMETPFRAGPIDLTCCFPPEFERDNIELTRITGAEVEIALARCCGDHQEHVIISLGEEEKPKKLRLCQGEGRELVRILEEQLGPFEMMDADAAPHEEEDDLENPPYDDDQQQRDTSDGDFDDYHDGESVERMERD